MWWVIENLLNGHFASRQKPFCFFFKNSIKVFNKVRLNLHVLFVQNLCSTKNVVFLEYSNLNHVFPTCYEVLTQPVFFIGRYSAYPVYSVVHTVQCTAAYCTVYSTVCCRTFIVLKQLLLADLVDFGADLDPQKCGPISLLLIIFKMYRYKLFISNDRNIGRHTNFRM